LKKNTFKEEKHIQRRKTHSKKKTLTWYLL